MVDLPLMRLYNYHSYAHQNPISITFDCVDQTFPLQELYLAELLVSFLNLQEHAFLVSLNCMFEWCEKNIKKFSVFNHCAKSCMISICGFVHIPSCHVEIKYLKFDILLWTKMFIKCTFCHNVYIILTRIWIFRSCFYDQTFRSTIQSNTALPSKCRSACFHLSLVILSTIIY